MQLADLTASRYSGVTIAEIAEEFGMVERSAQRMVRALEQAFPHSVEHVEGPDRRKRWRMRETRLSRLQVEGPDDLEALEEAIIALRERGDTRQAGTLARMRDRMMASLPVKAALAAEADADALLEAHGVAARPGPMVKPEGALSDLLAHALRGPYRMLLNYTGERREVEPYGILIGPRRYLVARQPAKGPEMRHFRIDFITEAEVTDQLFNKDEGFVLRDYAARAFGAYQRAEEFGEAVWIFSAEAADRAAEWRFHPSQSMRRLPDGRLEVRFHASGWLEMAWHLFTWGDSVEVVSPPQVRELLEGTQRNFGVLP